MRFYLLLSTVFLVLTACDSKNQALVLKVKNDYRFSNNSEVLVGESETGKFEIGADASYISLIITSKNGALPKIPMDSELQLSEDATLEILKAKVIRGKSMANIKTGDTLAWGKTKEEKELEKTIIAGDFLFVSDKDSTVKKLPLKKIRTPAPTFPKTKNHEI